MDRRRHKPRTPSVRLLGIILLIVAGTIDPDRRADRGVELLDDVAAWILALLAEHRHRGQAGGEAEPSTSTACVWIPTLIKDPARSW